MLNKLSSFKIKSEFSLILTILRFDHQNDYGNKDFIVNETLSNINRIKLGEIIRTNQYGNQSHCLTSEVTKVYNKQNYCSCKE